MVAGNSMFSLEWILYSTNNLINEPLLLLKIKKFANIINHNERGISGNKKFATTE